MFVRLLLACVIVCGAGHGSHSHDGHGHGHDHAHTDCEGHGHDCGHGHNQGNDEHDHSRCNQGSGKCNHDHEHNHEHEKGKDPSTAEKIFLNPFTVCAYLTVIAAIMGLVPERIIKQYKGVFIGVCCGAVAAIIFAELIPESIELAYKHGHGERWGSVCNGNHDHGHDHHHHDDEDALGLHFMSRLLGGLVLAGLMGNLLMEFGLHALMPGGHSHFGDECNDPSHNHGHSHAAVAHGHGHGCQAHGHGVVKPIHPCEIEDPTNQPPKASWCRQFLQIPSSVWIFTVAMTLHHIGDGLLVGLQKKNLQKCATIAIGIAAHEFPHCLGAISYFVTQGCQKTHAIILLLLSGSGYFIGAGTIYLFEKWEDEVELYGTFLVLGVFLYVLFFILMPEFMKFDKGVRFDALIRGGCFLLSLSAVSTLIYVLHTH